MSIDNINNLFVNTRYLRDHVCNLQEEKKIALRLYEHISAIKNLSDDPTVSSQCNSILNDVDKLVAYFQKMSDAVLLVEQDAIQLSSSIKETVNESSESVEIAIAKSFGSETL